MLAALHHEATAWQAAQCLHPECRRPLPRRPTAAAQQAALCVGHWEAVQALAAAAAPGGGLTLSNTDEFTVLLKTYNCMANTCPWLATPSFYEPLRQALLRVSAGSHAAWCGRAAAAAALTENATHLLGAGLLASHKPQPA